MKRRKRLPPEDRVKVKKIRRNQVDLDEAVALQILTLIHWELVLVAGRDVVEEALSQALDYGRWWYKIAPNGDGGLVDYCEFVVSAAKDRKVINDVEFRLWFSNPKDDPRLLQFRRGFAKAKMEAEEAKAKKEKKP
jgi:hypothetical protein